MSKNLKELNDKIEELDAATDELWDIKDKHLKKIEELEKELSKSHVELHDIITSYDDDINKISFHEQKIEALLRRVKNLEMGTKTSKMISNKQIYIIAGALIICAFIFAYSNRYKITKTNNSIVNIDTWTGCYNVLGKKEWKCPD